MTVPPVRLDPLQRLVDVSFGNKIAVIYAHAGRINEFVPPQVVVSLGGPVSFNLINMDALLGAAGIGSGGAPIGNAITGAMLRAYRAWRIPSVEVYSAGHADRVGVHCAVVLNLSKFSAVANIGVSTSAAGVGENFTSAQVALGTYRNAENVALLSEGSGDAIVDGLLISHAFARRQTPGSITGTINPRTLAVTLVGENSGGSGGGGGGQG